MPDMSWKEEYNVGVDYIDTAHRTLFLKLRMLVNILDDNNYENNKKICAETIEFLKAYAVKHFAEEEAYQIQIGYKDREIHKSLHDNLKNVLLPAIEAKLIETDFSKEAINEFVGLLAGWLAGHILIEDRAITGRSASKWADSIYGDAKERINTEFVHFMKDFSALDFNLINGHYEGNNFGEAFFYRMEYEEGVTVTLACQNEIVLKMASIVLGREFHDLDKVVVVGFIQLARSIAKATLDEVDGVKEHVLLKHNSLTFNQLNGEFFDGFPEISLLWKSQLGCFMLCVKRQK